MRTGPTSDPSLSLWLTLFVTTAVLPCRLLSLPDRQGVCPVVPGRDGRNLSMSSLIQRPDMGHSCPL